MLGSLGFWLVGSVDVFITIVWRGLKLELSLGTSIYRFGGVQS